MCGKKMKQQFIGLQHCKCGMSWKKDIGFFERTKDMVFALEREADRLLGRDRLGFVPEHVIPSYCEAWFPGTDILDFINLPYEKDEYELMLPKITWLEEQEQKLLKKI